VSKTASFWLVAAMAAGMAVPAAAQDTDREKARALLAQVMGGQTPQGVTAAQQSSGPSIELTSEQAVARALDKNLTLASQRITPETWDLQIAATLANYRPNLTSAFSNQSAVQLNTNLFAGGNRVTQDTQAWSGGLAQNVWWGGGNYVVNFTNNRAASDATNSTVNPSYQSGLQAQYVQPLLKNFKIDQNRATVQSNKISQDISEIALMSTTASTVAQVRNAYWELVYARQAVDAAQASLDLASKLVADNRSRVEIGTMAPIDIVQAQADEATRRQTLVNAQATLRNNELALKQLIVSGTEDELWRATIVPTDLPTSAPVPIDLEGAVQTALSTRTDLATTKKNLESTDVQLRTFVNQTLPQLDFIGTYTLNGRGGTALQRDPQNPLNIINTIPGGYIDALRGVGTFDAPTWNARVQFALPLGVSAPKANVARQRLIRRQTEADLKAVELTIATDVTTAALNIRNSLEAMQAATAARELSQKRLEAAQSKFEVGMSNNFEVLQAQRDLADARNVELRQTLNYQRALVDFERAQISPR
jgi:outer membrane protein TolC